MHHLSNPNIVTISEMEKRDLSDRLQVTKNKVSTLQTQIDTTRAERNDLEVSLEVSQNKLTLLEEERRKDASKSDSIKSQFAQSLDESQRECDHLREELVRTQAYVRDLEANKSVLSEVEDIASRSSTPPIEFTSQTNILERSLFGSSTPVSPSQSIPSHSSYAMEKITSQLKQSQVLIAFPHFQQLQFYFRLLILHTGNISTFKVLSSVNQSYFFF